MKMKELQKEAEELRTKLRSVEHEIEQIEGVKQKTRLAPLVGQCFLYINDCFSCPSGPNDYWDVYYKVIRITEDGWLDCLVFQTDSEGCMVIKRTPVSEQFFEEHLKSNGTSNKRFNEELLRQWDKVKEE